MGTVWKRTVFGRGLEAFISFFGPSLHSWLPGHHVVSSCPSASLCRAVPAWGLADHGLKRDPEYTPPPIKLWGQVQGLHDKKIIETKIVAVDGYLLAFLFSQVLDIQDFIL